MDDENTPPVKDKSVSLLVIRLQERDVFSKKLLLRLPISNTGKIFKTNRSLEESLAIWMLRLPK
jgi:hypothetical protein